MPTFTPPTVVDVPPFDTWSEEHQTLGWRLRRHAPAGTRGRNVYILVDNTVTENPGDFDDVRVTFHGGRQDPYTVVQADADLLTAAGYQVDP